MDTLSKVELVKLTLEQLRKFLHDQTQTLIEFGYHTALKMTEDEFSAYSLKTAGRQIPEFLEVEEHQLPILLVIPGRLLSLEKQMELLDIQSDHRNPVRDNDGVLTLPQPYLIFGAEYRELENIFPEKAPQHLESSRQQVLTFIQGLAMIAQCEELQLHCDSLIFAGSYWFISQTRQAPEFSCRDAERRIMGRFACSSYCQSFFALCQRNSA